MSQQNTQKKVLVSFPPVHQLIKKYNSVSTHNLHEPEFSLFSRSPSFVSHKSSMSQKSLSRAKMFFSNHSESFKKDSIFRLSQKVIRQDQPTKRKVQQVKRTLDKLQVLDTYKRLNQPKINPRFIEKTENLFRVSDYENFSPFKRNYAISRSPKKEKNNPELRMKKSNIERK